MFRRNPKQSQQTILVLAPHTDDGELGAGGAIAKFVEAGDQVFYCAFSVAEEAIPAHLPKDILLTEVKEATSRLGILPEYLTVHKFPVRRLQDHRQEILDVMIKMREHQSFDLVLMPSLNDTHQDHQVIAAEAVRAFKNTSILGYELPWNNLVFGNTCFITLNEDFLNKKIYALQAYQSQTNRKYMAKDYIEGLARARGMQINSDYAEVFEVVRWVM